RLDSATHRRLRIHTQRLAALTDRLRRQNIATRIAITHRRLQAATQRLQTVATQTLATSETRLNRASTCLEALSPLAVLNRGYALIYTAEGVILRSSTETAPGDTIHARLAQGSLEATIKQTK
ncbi:exodeoxyribonuclease VII large subunit, partial [Granulicella sp. L60]|uniref:exodeoxyribonuclease VII large subunit n=1 Tax=Granulicella sp. L60 TaxID=1641866 RepID=UPI002739A841